MTSAAAAGARTAAASRPWWRGQHALLGTAVTLIGTTGITTLLGLAFWWVAAQLVPVAAVGYGSAAVSALTLLGTFGMAGLNTVLISQLARNPRDAAGLLSAALYASAIISVLLAAGFWLAAMQVAPTVVPYLHTGYGAVLFILGSGLTGASLLLDEALLGMLGGGLQLWRNTVFAVAKLGALAGLVMLWHDRFGTSIPAAWATGTALSVIPVVILLRRRGIRFPATPLWTALRGLGRASMSNTWLNNSLQAPGLILPMFVTGLLSGREGGAFYVASTVAMVATVLPYHFTTALFASSAADLRGVAGRLRFTMRICMLGGLAGVPLVIMVAHPLLELFGSSYADQATAPLQLLILGYFGSVLKNHYIALCRISGHITRAAVFGTVTMLTRLAAAAAGALLGGLTGLSLAVLAVMTAEGAAAAPAVWATMRSRDTRWLSPGLAARATAVGHAASGRSAAVSDRPAGSRPPAAGAGGQPVQLPWPAAVTGTAAPEHPAQVRPVRVCYYLQTHTRPEQVARLVSVIKEGSPGSVVLISHDAAGPPLDVWRLESVPGVHVLTEPGGYGDYSHLDRYFAAVDWLDAHGVEYDWLENITGQDYPLRPIADIENSLAASPVDGYLLYAPVFPDRTPPDADRGAAPRFELANSFDAAMRYSYRHWWIGRPTRAKQRWLRPLMGLNLIQPWFRVSLAFSTVGVRRRHTVFSDDFAAYGGWFFCTLSRPCVHYARDFARGNPGLVTFFRTVLAPEEVFLQTVLVNSGKFLFEPDAKRYIDLSSSCNNHSKTLGLADLDAMLASGANWARKFDQAEDAAVLDALDRHIGRGQP